MKNKPIAWALVLILIGVVQAQNTYVLLSEDFEDLPLGESVQEAVGTPDVWTDTPPDGWSIDESGVPGIDDPATDGMTEWAGWAFTNKDWWIQVAGDQRRTEFTLGEGTVAVADPDEWDDATHPGPNSEDPFDTWLSTRPIDLSTARPGTLQLTFDSSWRPEYDDDYRQTGNLTVSFDGAEPIELFLWESNSASPNFKDDNSTNETITVAIDNPAGAASMVLTFGLFDAGNDWWWAIDNIVVTGDRLAERAFGPKPANAETGLPAKTVLSWTPGAYVDGLSPKHKVILSDDINAVQDGTAVVSTPDANSFDATGLLDYGTPYYWRIDEANGVSGWDEGSIWTFSVEAYSFAVPIGAVSATATSASAGQDPSNLVNGSGLNENDEHSNLQEFMWIGEDTDMTPAVTFKFDKLVKLDKVNVWNHNTQTESILGFGFKETLIESSMDGENWDEVATVELAQATGLATYSGDEVSLDGAVARYIRFTGLSNYSILGLPQKGLAEVRFYAIPVLASEPDPADESTTDGVALTLQWRTGREAVEHEVLFSTDEQAVIDGSAVVATVSEPAYDPGTLELDTPYFWQINEVNDLGTPPVYEGELWTFLTPDRVMIDDFERYTTKEGLRIWEYWIDGFDNQAENGGVVGNGDEAENAVVYEGSQSMPVTYNNNLAPKSEVTRFFDPALDLSQGGAANLKLQVMGDPNNGAAPMYVVLADKAGKEITVDHPDPAATVIAAWDMWTIPLSDLDPVDVTEIDSITIGVGSSGVEGKIFIDAIRAELANKE